MVAQHATEVIWLALHSCLCQIAADMPCAEAGACNYKLDCTIKK